MRFFRSTVLMGIMLPALMCVFPANGYAQTIKLASIAPEGSPWGEALNKMSAEWSTISGGTVELKIYHNGIAGDEANMLRKLKMGQIQGGVFTSLGMMELAPQVMTISSPLLIRNDDELDYVMERLTPFMNKAIEEKNYITITWAKAGWVRFFAKGKVITPADLKKYRLVASPDDPAFSQIFKQMGYDQVPVAITDVLQSLNSGLTTAIWASPLAVAGYQWFGIANHMTDLKIAPFLGAFIISKGTWLSIPAHLRPKLIEAAHRITSELDGNLLKLENFVFSVMKSNGLIIHPVPPVPFKPKEVLKSLKESIWEILIPFFILVPFLFGITKLVETSAFILLYTLIVEVVVHREIKWRDLPNVILKGVIIIGGVLVIIGTAQAFSEFIIDQQVPMLLASWMKQTIQSPILFLLILNAALLVTGCFMDIYAALIVVVPLIIPLGKVFGIDPVHLGIIFIINMEIGFLTPPVGLNLFLSSYCFGKPIGKIYRNTMPFFLIQIGVLFCVTYLPYIFKAVVGLFGGDAGG